MVLDVGCGFGSFGAHLFSKELLTLCIANYEASGSQVQITLERGIPAMLGSFASKQLPFPSLSFDMLHCARCGIDWEKNGVYSIVRITLCFMLYILYMFFEFTVTLTTNNNIIVI